jgi:hypothetical protein|tara:strand:- start:1764 stop:2657 length:894 start_codon:yes stop_codon:yes gene_type:complete
MAKGPTVCAAVAGNPISHSLTPFLFKKVAQHLQSRDHTITFHTCEKIQHTSLIDALAWGHAKMTALAKEDEGADPTKREIWLSITSPLKHQLPIDSGIEWPIGEPMLASVNQMRHDGHVWNAANTDGAGLLMVAREFGFDFNLTDDLDCPLLCMTGGGSTARACAAAWTEAGGEIWWKEGRRNLSPRGPWKDSIVNPRDVCDHVGRRLHIDFDQPAGSAPEIKGERIDAGIDAPVFLSVSYSDGEFESVIENEWGLFLDGRWLLAAQHLQGWAHLYYPPAADDLPTLSELMDILISY